MRSLIKQLRFVFGFCIIGKVVSTQLLAVHVNSDFLNVTIDPALTEEAAGLAPLYMGLFLSEHFSNSLQVRPGVACTAGASWAYYACLDAESTEVNVPRPRWGGEYIVAVVDEDCSPIATSALLALSPYDANSEVADDDCVCQPSWIYDGVTYEGCATTSDSPNQAWCYILLSTCSTGTASVNSGCLGCFWQYCGSPPPLPDGSQDGGGGTGTRRPSRIEITTEHGLLSLCHEFRERYCNTLTLRVESGEAGDFVVIVPLGVPIPSGSDLILRYRWSSFKTQTVATQLVLNASATDSSPITLQVPVPYYTRMACVVLLLSREPPTGPGGLRRIVAASNATFLNGVISQRYWDLSLPLRVHTRSHFGSFSVDVSGRNSSSRDQVHILPAATFQLSATYAYNSGESPAAFLDFAGAYDFGAIVRDINTPGGFLHGLWQSGLIGLSPLGALVVAEATSVRDGTIAFSNKPHCETNCSITLPEFLPWARPYPTMWFPQYRARPSVNASFSQTIMWPPFFVPAEHDRCTVLPLIAPRAGGALPPLAPTPPPLPQRQSHRASNGRLPDWALGLLSVAGVTAVLLVACAVRHWSKRRPCHKLRGDVQLLSRLASSLSRTSSRYALPSGVALSLDSTPVALCSSPEEVSPPAPSPPPASPSSASLQRTRSPRSLEIVDSTDVELTEVTLDTHVGTGGYAAVWRGRWVNSVVAIKVTAVHTNTATPTAIYMIPRPPDVLGCLACLEEPAPPPPPYPHTPSSGLPPPAHKGGLAQGRRRGNHAPQPAPPEYLLLFWHVLRPMPNQRRRPDGSAPADGLS